MKFTDGAWMTKEGFDIHPAKEVRFVKAEDTKVTLTAPAFHIYNRGMTLTGPYITIEITSPCENAFRIRTYHFKGDKSLLPSYFNLNENIVSLKTEETEKTLTITSGESSLVFDKESYGYELIRNSNKITGSAGGSLAYINGSNGSYMPFDTFRTIFDKMIRAGKTLKKQAKNNDANMFETSIFPKEFERVAQKCYMEQMDAFSKLFEDEQFYKRVMSEMAKAMYMRYRNGDDKPSNVVPYPEAEQESDLSMAAEE